MAVREEHIRWVKKCALIELENGTVIDAIASLQRDFKKHPDTQNHQALKSIISLSIEGKLSTEAAMKTFIEGIN